MDWKASIATNPAQYCMVYKTLLTYLLRVVGTVELLAFLAVFMPRDLMAEYHVVLGLGEFPRLGITDFMIRQASYTYGMHGVALWLMSSNIERYRPLLILTGISYLIAGPLFAWIDTSSGMPLWWTLLDGGGCLFVGLAILLLLWTPAWQPDFVRRSES